MFTTHYVLNEDAFNRLTEDAFEELGDLQEAAIKVAYCCLPDDGENTLITFIDITGKVRTFEVFWWDRQAAGCDDGWGAQELEVITNG